jgi:hypothetical protein
MPARLLFDVFALQPASFLAYLKSFRAPVLVQPLHHKKPRGGYRDHDSSQMKEAFRRPSCNGKPVVSRTSQKLANQKNRRFLDLRLRAERPRVTRLSRNSLIGLGGVTSAAFVIGTLG